MESNPAGTQRVWNKNADDRIVLQEICRGRGSGHYQYFYIITTCTVYFHYRARIPALSLVIFEPEVRENTKRVLCVQYLYCKALVAFAFKK